MICGMKQNRPKIILIRSSALELIAGRQSIKLKISPPGGRPYYLWVDKETNLPIQLQTPMENALQTTYTFVSFEPNVKIEAEIFAYQPPEGYQVVTDNPGQLAATIEEAALISKISPLVPKEAPLRILAFHDRIVLDYGETIVVETAARGVFKPAPEVALGTAAGEPLEVLAEKLEVAAGWTGNTSGRTRAGGVGTTDCR